MLLNIDRMFEACDEGRRRRMALYLWQKWGGSVNPESIRKAEYRASFVPANVPGNVPPDVPDDVPNGPSSTKAVLLYYSELFEKQFGLRPRISYGRDGAIVKSVVKQFGEEKVRDLLGKFFSTEDEFIRKSGHTLGIFASQINKLIVNGQPPPPPKPKSKNPTHSPNCECDRCKK